MKKLKILFFTDSHISFKTPTSRIDDYQEAIYNKISELVELANKESFDYILCGGDLFHNPSPTPNSAMIANEISKLFLKSKAKVVVVPGNHDLYSYNISTLNKTLLGIYQANEVVRILDRTNPLTIKLGDKEIAIEGQEYHIGIDKYSKEDYECNCKADFNILVTHSMITSSVISKHYEKNKVNHIDINAIETTADILLSGHEHNGYKQKKTDKTLFLNPGSLSRTDSTLKHKPKALIIEINENLNYTVDEYILKTAKDYNDIFDNTLKNEKNNKDILLDKFKQEIKDISVSQCSNIETIIEEISQANEIPKDIINTAYSYLELADQKNLSTKHIKKQDKIIIKRIEINNFQSHKHSVIELDNGLNALVGVSDSGKSAIVRALIWCLYNYPKGDEFIRTGENKTSVKVSLSDGSYIIRSRDKKSSGSYTVCDVNGELQHYEGFGSELPIEVENEHQMPYIPLTKDKSINVNISQQLDQPFLLTESPSVKAIAVGKITNTDKVDAAIKTISSDCKSVQKEIKTLSKLLKEKNSELIKYEDLDNDKKLIDILEDKFEKYYNLLEEFSELENMLKGYNKIESRISELENLLNKRVDFELVESRINSSKDAINILIMLADSYSNLNRIDKYIDDCKKEIEYILDFDKINKYIKEANDNYNKLLEIIDCAGKCSVVVKKMNIEKQSWSSNSAKINSIKECITYNENILEETVREMDLCPVCNTKLGDEQINHLKGR